MKGLEVLLCKETGVPYLEVPSEFMWQLLEYFALHRVRTIYDYDTHHLTAFFLYCDRDTAQRLVGEWSRSCGLSGVSQRLASDALAVAPV